MKARLEFLCKQKYTHRRLLREDGGGRGRDRIHFGARLHQEAKKEGSNISTFAQPELVQPVGRRHSMETTGMLRKGAVGPL